MNWLNHFLSLTQWTWVWVNSGSWWWTGRPGVLRFMGLQRVRHDWATELNWSKVSLWASLVAQMVESACSAGDPGSIPGLGRSPGEENGNPLQYSCLENPMERGVWQSTVYGVAKRHDWATSQAKSGMLRTYFYNFLTYITLCTTFANNSVLFISPLTAISF